MSVYFLNPGSSDDPFFGLMERVIKKAASDLGIHLEIESANRNHIVMKKLGLKMLDRQNLPDYLLLINEKGFATDILEQANKKGVKVLLINEALTKSDYVKYGKPREKLTNWIGEFLPDDRQSGYILAKALIKEATKGKLRDAEGKISIVGLTGTHATSSSVQRVLGLKDAIKESKGVVLRQVVHAFWDTDKAEKATLGLLKRYPKASVVWTASDGMALGALKAIKKMNLSPGENIVTGGVDWAEFAFKHIEAGDFAATVGGHYLDGAWALVMLYDYHNGLDFPINSKSSFYLMDKSKRPFYKTFLNDGKDWSKVNFNKFSKFNNPKLKRPKFSAGLILDIVN
jgi:ABC-type sugar transport system substrate-binding protein